MLGRCPGEGKGYPPQCSGLENATDCIVRGVAKSRTLLSNFHFQDKEGVIYLSVIVVGYSPRCVWLFVTLKDCHPPGSSVHGIFQARMLEWVAMSFSRASSPPRDQTHVSCIGIWILNHWATRERHDVIHTHTRTHIHIQWNTTQS